VGRSDPPAPVTPAGAASRAWSPDRTRAAVRDGARLFDAGRFFEAHDAWEEAWRVEEGDARRLLQGLIQIAAGFHKGLVHGRPSGMAKLLGTGLARLAGVPAADGLSLDPFRSEVERWRDAALAWAAGGTRPGLAPPKVGAAPPGDGGSPGG
jgi:uncharacterized protein